MGWAMTEGEINAIGDYDYSMTVWIAKDTFYLVEMDVNMSIKVEGLADRMFMTMIMTMYGFDSPVFISLPAEAADAYGPSLNLRLSRKTRRRPGKMMSTI
jgi:hypothetical protein